MGASSPCCNLASGRRGLVRGCQLGLDSWPTIELTWLRGHSGRFLAARVWSGRHHRRDGLHECGHASWQVIRGLDRMGIQSATGRSCDDKS